MSAMLIIAGILDDQQAPSLTLSLSLDTQKLSHNQKLNVTFQCSDNRDRWCVSTFNHSNWNGEFDDTQATLVNSTDHAALNSSGKQVMVDPLIQQLINLGNDTLAQTMQQPHSEQEELIVNLGSIWLKANRSGNEFAYAMLTNTTASHSSALLRVQIDQAFYRVVTNNSDFKLEVVNQPLPLTKKMTFLTQAADTGLTVSALLINLVLSYFPASIVGRLVDNRHHRQLQLRSGMRVWVYWLAQFVIDTISALLLVAGVLFVIVVFDIDTWLGNQDLNPDDRGQLACVATLLVAFAAAVSPFAYVISFWFTGRKTKHRRSARVKSFMFFVGVGSLAFLLMNFLEGPDRGDRVSAFVDEPLSALDILRYVLSLSPFFSLSSGLDLLAYRGQQATVDGNNLGVKSPFDPDIAQASLVCLLVAPFMYLGLAVLLDIVLTYPEVRAIAMKDSPYRSRGNTVTPGPGTILDDNVERERRRIAAQRGPLADPHRQDDVQLYNVSKLVPTASSPITALLSTSVGFYAGECFCVLGVKGSGKSTLLKILAGETLPTTGDVIVSGYHIVDELWEVRQRRIVGYCPQDDKCLDPLLRVREHFEMLAAMNNMGATDDARCTIVMQVVNTMGLTNCQNCLIGSLSQCEQRLVSIGSAIMGLPPVVLLDEPTARVDAASRERIWRILRTLCIDQRACTLIVATQNLDECEALSSRVGVVVDGMLQSFDVFEELARMGDFGWVLDVQTAEPTDAKIDELARGYFDDSEQFLTSATLTGKCEAMGNSFWVNNISSTHPTGQWLALALARDGFLSRTVFCTWWLSELRHEAFLQSLENAFGRDYMRLLFREHARCRFQLILEESDLRLSQVFKMLEKAKCQNNISQYFLQRSTLQEVLATHAMTAHPTRSWYR